MNEARKAQEELSYDLKALEESLQSYHNEDLERAQRKVFPFHKLSSCKR